MFLHKCVLQYVRSLKLNDATLALLGKLKYSIWRPRWPQKDKILNSFLSMWARHIIFLATHRFFEVEESIKPVKIYFRHISQMYTKWRTKWPPKHELPDISFNIWARIIILVFTCRFLGSRNSISMFKLILRHIGYTKWQTRWRTKQRPRHRMSKKCTFW